MANEDQCSTAAKDDLPHSNGPTVGGPNVGGPNVGALLHASRMRCGERLRDVAQMLNIRYPYLEAIEDGRYDDLPGPAYASGFIRAYAEHLGLDSGEVIRRFKAETSNIHAKQELLFPVPISETSFPGGAVLFIGALVASIAYAGWYVTTTNNSFLAELISPPPERYADISPEIVAPLLNDDGTAVDVAGEEAESQPSPYDANAAEVDREAAEEEQPLAADVTEAETEPVTETLPVTQALEQAQAEVETHTETAASVETPLVAEDLVPVTSVARLDVGTTETVSSEGIVTSEEETVQSDASPAIKPAPQTETQPPEEQITEAKFPTAASADTADTEEAGQVETATNTVKTEVPSETAVPAEVPAAASEAATEAAQKPAAVSKPKVETATADTSVSDSADSSTATSDEPKPEPAPQVAAIPSLADTPDTGRVYGAEESESRIVVLARDSSWIQVRDDIANKMLLTRLLRSGDSYRVPDRPGLKLLTGNAGALDILVDGDTVPALGKDGQVLRGVVLNADRLREGTAASEQ